MTRTPAPDEVEARIRQIINRHAEYMDGFDRGQRNFGRDAVMQMLRAALAATDREALLKAERERCAKVMDEMIEREEARSLPYGEWIDAWDMARDAIRDLPGEQI